MNKIQKIVSLLLLFALSSATWAQKATKNSATNRLNKVKVVIDNDFCGDPDGLFQLAHQMLCTTCDVRAIVGGHLSTAGGFTNRKDQATESCEKAEKVLELMGLKGTVKVVPGAENGLTSTTEPIRSQGAQAIVDEARQCTPDHPLYVLCGASLTNIACAHLMDPSIDDKVVLVWIGGQEYTGVSAYPPQAIRRWNTTSI